MQPIESGQSQASLLRFVFKNTVVSFALAADATLEDIAQTMRKLSKRRYQDPVAIYVTLSRASRPHPLH